MFESADLPRNALLFKDIKSEDLEGMLTCLSATQRRYAKGSFIYRMGDTDIQLALLLDGDVHIITEDYWGNQTILAEVRPGDIFAEAYALSPSMPFTVNAVALSDCSILFLNANRIITTCPNHCAFHATLIKNLAEILARKNLMLTDKVEHMAQRTTRNKLLSYLSHLSRQVGNRSFEIPFNRQQLADYLAVDRSALSAELSKLKQEGLMDFDKNRFTLH